MALGHRRSKVMRLFLSEGMVLGLIGGALGSLLGVALASVISAIGVPMPPPPGMANGFVGEILVTPQLVVEALVLAFSTTLLASVFPAWKASRMEIVDALRHNR
jgi:putative ABC transport system permease protein